MPLGQTNSVIEEQIYLLLCRFLAKHHTCTLNLFDVCICRLIDGDIWSQQEVNQWKHITVIYTDP